MLYPCCRVLPSFAFEQDDVVFNRYADVFHHRYRFGYRIVLFDPYLNEDITRLAIGDKTRIAELDYGARPDSRWNFDFQPFPFSG